MCKFGIFHFEKLVLFHSNFLSYPVKQPAVFINENHFLEFLISPWYLWANSFFSRIHCRHLNRIHCKRFNQMFTMNPNQQSEILKRLIVSHHWLWKYVSSWSFTDRSVGTNFSFPRFWRTHGDHFGEVGLLYFCIDQRYFSE